VTRMGEERKVCNVWWESPKERGHSEDQGSGGMKESEWILGRLAWGCRLDSTDSGSQDREGWRAVVNTVMTFLFFLRQGFSYV
jgi:hypothetical protein